MALIRKIKLVVFESRTYDLTGQNGKQYKGYLNKGFNEGNTVVQFTSPEPVKVVDAGEFDPALAIDLLLYGRTYGTETKWSTVKPQ